MSPLALSNELLIIEIGLVVFELQGATLKKHDFMFPANLILVSSAKLASPHSKNGGGARYKPTILTLLLLRKLSKYILL